MYEGMTAETITAMLWDIIINLPEPAQNVVEEIIGRLADEIPVSSHP